MEEKGIEPSSKNLEATYNSLKHSFKTIYYAVALDVDGTITEEKDQRIPREIGDTLSGLLDKGVYVIFVTGGGSTTAEKIIKQLQEYNNKKEKWRIFVITGEGCHLRRLAGDGTVEIHDISPSIEDLIGPKNYNTMIDDLVADFGEDFDISRKHCVIRMVSKQLHDSEALKSKLDAWFSAGKSYLKVAGIKPIMGNWGGNLTFDITYTNKDYALSWFYTEFDFADIPILRVGDQGVENGNDYLLLDSVYGFSVGSLSGNPSKSFPIFNMENGNRRLLGTEATNYILNQMKFERRLSMPSFIAKESLDDYRSAIEKVKIEADRDTNDAINEWKSQASQYLSEEKVDWIARTRFSPVFDNKSGAIWLSDTEWDEAGKTDFFYVFSEKFESSHNDKNKPLLKRAMYLDKGIILRGPYYYWSMALSQDKDSVEELVNENRILLELLYSQVDKGMEHEIGLLYWKLGLALIDNLRNNSLLLFTMVYEATSITTNSRPYWKRLLLGFQEYVNSIISIYYSWLLFDKNSFSNYMLDLRRSDRALYELRNNIHLLYDFLLSNSVDSDKVIRKWREVDHPGELYISVRRVCKEIGNLGDKSSSLSAIGLMYGGIELPYLLRFLYKRIYDKELKIAHIGGISFYQRKGESMIMNQYASSVLEGAMADANDIYDVLPQSGIAIIMDDNTMTGRTLELARDRLISHGIKVPFVACVRYPPEHRIKQMEMRRHGGVDPSSFGTDIRGFVSMSPYTRIFSEKSYKDPLNIFDIARWRIKRYLEKNGFPTESAVHE